jgi:hypothetical protein
VANQEDENIDTGVEISDECSIMFTQTSLKIWGRLADMDFTSPPVLQLKKPALCVECQTQRDLGGQSGG